MSMTVRYFRDEIRWPYWLLTVHPQVRGIEFFFQIFLMDFDPNFPVDLLSSSLESPSSSTFYQLFRHLAVVRHYRL